MELSIIIVSFNTQGLLSDCIKSVKKNTKGISYEIIVVDNKSKDESVSISKKLGARVISNNENLGFAAANNQGIKIAKGEFVLFLNSDTIINDNVLGEIVDYMKKNSNISVSSCMLKNEDGSIQGTGGYFPTLIRVFSWMTIQDIPFVDKIILPFHPLHANSPLFRGEDFYKKSRQLDWLTGAFLLIRRDVLKKVGDWDEKYFMYVEEVDLAYRIKKAGFQIWYLPEWSITHLGGKSSMSSEFSIVSEYKSIVRFYQKFYPKWQLPILKVLLKIGALGRMALFGILKGYDVFKIYAKAYQSV